MLVNGLKTKDENESECTDMKTNKVDVCMDDFVCNIKYLRKDAKKEFISKVKHCRTEA